MEVKLDLISSPPLSLNVNIGRRGGGVGDDELLRIAMVERTVVVMCGGSVSGAVVVM